MIASLLPCVLEAWHLCTLKGICVHLTSSGRVWRALLVTKPLIVGRCPELLIPIALIWQARNFMSHCNLPLRRHRRRERHGICWFVLFLRGPLLAGIRSLSVNLLNWLLLQSDSTAESHLIDQGLWLACLLFGTRSI